MKTLTIAGKRYTLAIRPWDGALTIKGHGINLATRAFDLNSDNLRDRVVAAIETQRQRDREASENLKRQNCPKHRDPLPALRANADQLLAACRDLETQRESARIEADEIPTNDCCNAAFRPMCSACTEQVAALTDMAAPEMFAKGSRYEI